MKNDILFYSIPYIVKVSYIQSGWYDVVSSGLVFILDIFRLVSMCSHRDGVRQRRFWRDFLDWREHIQRLKETNPSSFDDWSSFHGWISKINCHPWSQQKQARQPEGQRSFWVWKLCVVTVRRGRDGMTFVKLKESPS